MNPDPVVLEALAKRIQTYSHRGAGMLETKEALKEMCRRYLAGASCGALADHFGVTQTTISNHLKRLGVYEDPARRKLVQKTITRAEKGLMVGMMLSGLSNWDISLQTGYSEEEVDRAITTAYEYDEIKRIRELARKAKARTTVHLVEDSVAPSSAPVRVVPSVDVKIKKTPGLRRRVVDLDKVED
ncbi:hypothetical protein MUN46_011465 [Mesosutterella sp. AGMB02718]|uniref:Helix-turn-helix domain-containing protein n=1 Tax=Mesosutterella faecium TaxID=2925194 RepID=A0ABT7IQ92_9BURK|nr:hypothetical protein [Mesosutterella sp. AGMB02718]MDL2060331.1 hypothetical protein [Mesosutterella sp. AGMB02718]MDL2060554.1 hypothetical protein [Mesosutterella sp. AGMB02718]